MQQMRGGSRTAQELKNSRKTYTNKLCTKSYKLDAATPFRFFTLRRLRVLAFAGLNITGGRAASACYHMMPWPAINANRYAILLILTGFIMAQVPQRFTYAYINRGSYLADIVMHAPSPFTHQQLQDKYTPLIYSEIQYSLGTRAFQSFRSLRFLPVCSYGPRQPPDVVQPQFKTTTFQRLKSFLLTVILDCTSDLCNYNDLNGIMKLNMRIYIMFCDKIFIYLYNVWLHTSKLANKEVASQLYCIHTYMYTFMYVYTVVMYKYNVIARFLSMIMFSCSQLITNWSNCIYLNICFASLLFSFVANTKHLLYQIL